MCVIVTEVRARAAPGLHAKPPTALPPASMEPPAGRLFLAVNQQEVVPLSLDEVPLAPAGVVRFRFHSWV